MLEIHRNYIFDKNQQPVAVQTPITEFEQIEEIIENYGLAKLMDKTKAEKQLYKEEALKYYQSMKSNKMEN